MEEPAPRTDGGTEEDRDYSADRDRREADRDSRDSAEDVSSQFASTAVWLTLIIVGLFLTIFALGRAFGVDMFAMLEDAMQTQMGQYLLLALVGILLIIVAQRGLMSR